MKAKKIKAKKKIVFDKPFKYTGKGRYKMSVYVKDSTKKQGYKRINFGHKDYRHNYSAKARKNYCSRSAGIKGKSGKTANNKKSANYWSRKVLWNC